MQAALMRLSNRASPPKPLLFRLVSSYSHSSSSSSSCCSNSLPLPPPPPPPPPPPSSSSGSFPNFNLFTAPWSTTQCRGIKVSASDVRVGNIIEKQGRFYEVLKADHSHEGRGKATIKVELRDIGQGNKITQRMNTDEDIERVYVQEKTFMYMCMDHDGTVVLMDPDTLDQIEISRDLFGKNCLYLQDEMKVKVQFYDDKPLSASVPKRVARKVKEEIAATPRNKKVVLDNGITVEVPPHIVAGDAIVVSTEDDSYIERAKA